MPGYVSLLWLIHKPIAVGSLTLRLPVFFLTDGWTLETVDNKLGEGHLRASVLVVSSLHQPRAKPGQSTCFITCSVGCIPSSLIVVDRCCLQTRVGLFLWSQAAHSQGSQVSTLPKPVVWSQPGHVINAEQNPGHLWPISMQKKYGHEYECVCFCLLQ